MDETLAGGMAPNQQQPEDQTPAANQASPEEQAQYDQYVGRAMQLIYDKKFFPHLVDMLHGGAEKGQQAANDNGMSGPQAGLAHAAVIVLQRVGSAAKEAGQTISPDVVLHGGAEVFSQLAEISDRAGISNYGEDRDALEGAFFAAIDLYLKQAAQSGEVDQQAAQQQLQQLQQMDQSGQLETMLRDLDAKDQGQPSNENEQTEPPDEGLKGGMMPQVA